MHGELYTKSKRVKQENTKTKKKIPNSESNTISNNTESDVSVVGHRTGNDNIKRFCSLLKVSCSLFLSVSMFFVYASF